MLHESPIFGGPDIYEIASGQGSTNASAADARLPVTERLADTLMTIPPFTKVSARYVRQCAEALCKVADRAACASPRVAAFGRDREQRSAAGRGMLG
jgi:dTDP-4-amino-4,6-dideoxygalactose transaminase